MRRAASRGQTAMRCLRAAADLELRSGALYARLAERDGTPPWLAALLREISREEEQHAMRIGLLERLVTPDAWPEHAVVRITEDLGAARSALVRTEAELDRPGLLQPRAVLDAILAVELAFDVLHAEMMASTVSPLVTELFESLRGQDARHRELMGDARGKRPD